MAVVCTLQLAGTISLTIEVHEEEKEHVVSALLKNGYPKWFIHESASAPAQCDAVIEEPEVTVCLLYVQMISEPLKRILQGVNICDEITPDLKTEVGTSQGCYLMQTWRNQV